MANNPNNPTEFSCSNARRRALFCAVSVICTELGFDAADRAPVETLAEMLQSLITEIGRNSRAFTELACRTETLAGDVFVALVDLGINVDSIQAYAKRPTRMSLPPPAITPHPQTPKNLQAGVKHSHPHHVPDHLPQFPDPHAYIRTPTYKQPISEYQILRDKAASQKRDVERALTRFLAKTGDIHKLIEDDANTFLLIACKPSASPYLGALLPKDQAFEDEAEARKETPAKKANLAMDSSENADANEQRKEESEGEAIDNPYLRPTKLPKIKRK